MPRRIPVPSPKYPGTQDSQIHPTFQHLTISDDQSKGSGLDLRKLIALKGTESALSTQDNTDEKSAPSTQDNPDDSSNLDEAGLDTSDVKLFPEHPESDEDVLKDFDFDSFLQQPGEDSEESLSTTPIRTHKAFKVHAPFNSRERLLRRRAREMSAVRNMRVNHSSSGIIAQPPDGTNDDISGRDVHKPTRFAELPQHDMTLKELKLHIGNLQKKAQELESSQNSYNTEHYRTLYRVRSTDTRENDLYLDHPQWIEAGRTLRSRQALQNFDLFLERNKTISFIVIRDFDEAQKPRNRGSLIEPEPLRESIYVVSKKLDRAVKTLLSGFPEYTSLLRTYESIQELQAPYMLLYHTRDVFKQLVRVFPASTRQHITYMTDYIFKHLDHEYSEADALMSQGKISKYFLKYLFKPGEILVHIEDTNEYQGCVAETWPDAISTSDKQALDTNSELEDCVSMESYDFEFHSPLHRLHLSGSPQQEPEETGRNTSDIPSSLLAGYLRTPETSEQPYKNSIRIWSWGFYGSFEKQHTDFILKLPPTNHPGHRDDIFNITDLDIYPLKYASSTLKQRLQCRGKMFWQCRKRSLVSYREENGDLDQPFWERYMIDFGTFRSLHPSNEGIFTKSSRSADKMSDIQMEGAEPPDEQFEYMVPNQIKGYNLRTKKWHDLKVDWLYPVIWNEKIFETLVLDRKTKELIQALVSKQITAQKSTDVVTSKGNGLILLLHGGPGTGKTLTAEGVAEIAKKPLYRVTCGDVGTKAEDVEKYLESVLHLGKIWDCVVLLDEAEVFLEQRTLDNLQRNALVSVFLRVLEYHDGILILTSNRVGTFDEAFRSRIQIAIHYPALGVSRRRKIWNNFIDRLESFKDDTVDIEDLRGHIEDLQKFEMNGRQIRNAITTARQYAEWKGEKMDYEYLKDVVDVATKFDAYSTKLKGGYTDDQLAEEEGVR